MEDGKTIIKIANRVHQALMNLRKERYLESVNQLAKLVNQFKELGIESRKLGISLTHNWLLAAERCCSRANRVLSDIPYSVTRVKQLIEEPHKEMPKLSFLVEELNQLQQEFGDIDFDKKVNTLSVVTDPITLEDVYLGTFTIQLELNKLAELYKNSPYYVVAVDPNPAGTSEDVTHPHVSNERLCEGDGSVTIRAALEQGRLCDFFNLVHSILNTYNPDSPYVALHEWDGISCYDCGYTMGSEDVYFCEYCENNFCSECSTYCQLCDQTVCLGCAAECSVCSEMVCRECMKECAECAKLCCPSCLEEDGVCPDCKEKMETEENEEQENRITTDRQNGNENQPETNQAEIKLAS